VGAFENVFVLRTKSKQFNKDSRQSDQPVQEMGLDIAISKDLTFFFFWTEYKRNQDI
jgi:hypothetical protein